MRKKFLYIKTPIIFGVLSLSVGLCACANSGDSTVMCSTESTTEQSMDVELTMAETGTDIETTISEPSTEPETASEEPTYFLKDIDWEKFQAKLPEKEAETLQKYLPVLTGGEFTWINRSFASDNEPHEPRQAVIQDIHYEVDSYDTIVGYIAFADVFQSGTQDVVLFLHNIGCHYLILHEEDGVIYGIDYPVRWFQDLQENGLYSSSGGISYQVYHRMTFENGDYTDHIICKFDDPEFYLNGEKLGNTLEESAALLDAWREENTQHPVKEYNPFDVE